MRRRLKQVIWGLLIAAVLVYVGNECIRYLECKEAGMTEECGYDPTSFSR